jgi:2-isopropylmalate synthase
MADKLIIFDTTLRDGEQSPGASMTKDEKLRIARQLERLKVDVIEAGFAASSNGDFRGVQAIAKAIKDSTICSLSRANDRDIARAAEASRRGQSGPHPHLHRHQSPAHGKEAAHDARAGVGAGQAIGALCAQPGGRHRVQPRGRLPQRPDFLCRVLEAVIAEGATTINVPDTVGYAIPELYGNFIKTCASAFPTATRHLVRALPQRSGHGCGQLAGRREDRRCAPGGVHHQRPGRARRQLLAGRSRHGREDARDYFGLDVGIDTQHIVAASRMVSQTTGFVVQPNKAVVGANAFAHASGIHQDGVLKARDTYEIMRAEDVGWSANKIVLGKLSGRNAFKQRLQELGVQLESEADINTAFARSRSWLTARARSLTRTSWPW